MHRINRPLLAIRAPRWSFLSYTGRGGCLCILHNHVSFQRLLITTSPDPRWPYTIRCLSQSSIAATGQAAQSQRRWGDEEDDNEHEATHNTLSSKETSSSNHHHPDVHQSPAAQWQPLNSALATHPCKDNEQNGKVPSFKEDAKASTHNHDLPIDEAEFVALQGFWSLREPSSTAHDSTLDDCSPIPQQDDSKEIEEAQHKTQDWRQLWARRVRRNKIDLSRWDPVRGEREDTYNAQPGLEDEGIITWFRANKGGRTLVARFLDEFYHEVMSSKGLSDESAMRLLNDPVFVSIRDKTDLITDILNWSWVVSARPEQRVKRLMCVSQSKNETTSTKVPCWLVLQVLRSDRIEAPDFVNLLKLTDTMSDHWFSDTVPVMVLVVRLVRHALATAPTTLTLVIEYCMREFDRHFGLQSHIAHLQRRAHWCNRLLRLLAIPTPSKPFIHVRMQQDAQLLLLHYMSIVTPSIPLNREGYRALAMLQLMHAKTESEAAWAQVQAETWPPWEEQHQMGITSAPRESMGSVSRVNMVLGRMREDGYSPYTFEIAASVMGGRDSDGSPTAQVRRKPSVISINTPWKAVATNSAHKFDIAPQIWAARITATRTVREAWMGFCAYENIYSGDKPSQMVYLAMFHKLWAKTIPRRADGVALPGDGLENFPEPELNRDRVHVPEEPPTSKALYARMLATKTRPGGRLLSHLIQQEDDLLRGLQYIQESTIKAEQREILALPMLHSPEEIGKVLVNFHSDTIAAYIGLLARPNNSRDWMSVMQARGLPEKPFLGLLVASRIMREYRFSEPRVLTAYISGLAKHVYAQNARRRVDVGKVWKLMSESYHLPSSEVECSVIPHVLSVAWTVQTRSWPPGSKVMVTNDPVETCKKFFMKAVFGYQVTDGSSVSTPWNQFMRNTSPTLHSVPTADMIQDLAFLMVAKQAAGTIDGILELLRWSLEHKSQIMAVSSFTIRNMAAFRTYLEGQWITQHSDSSECVDQVEVADEEQLAEGKRICEELEVWAQDNEVTQYLRSASTRFAKVKKRLELAHRGS